MHFAVLASPNSWYVRDLTRAAGTSHEITALPFTQLRSTIATDSPSSFRISVGDHDLTQFDAVLIRTMPPGSLEQVVFRMDALYQLEQLGIPTINRPKAIEAAVDKYLTLARLGSAGFDVPKTETCQTVDDAMAAFTNLRQDVVIKPLFGSEGRGITRIQDEAIALRTFKLLVQLGAVIYLQEFIEHEGHDIRLLVIGDEVLGMKRSNKLDWRTNVSRGALAESLEVSPEMADQAKQAAEAVGASIAGVDFLPGRNGVNYAIEVNAVPGWRAMAKAQSTDVSKRVLDYVEQQ